MATKTIKALIKDTLADLKKEHFEAFVEALLDRREKPRVKRIAVDGKNYLTVTNVLVSTFTECEAPGVVAEILRQIDCNDEAEALVNEAAALSSNPGSSNNTGPSPGTAGGDTMAEGGCSDEHPVDKHRVELINRVSNVSPILDELLAKKVIGDEKFAEISKLPTSYAKIRELCCSLNSSGSKDIFYELLKKHENFLMKELNKPK